MTIPPRVALFLGLVGILAGFVLALSTNDPFWSWAGAIASWCLTIDDGDSMEGPK